MAEKTKNSYNFKESKKQTKLTNDNLKGDLVVAVYDVNGIKLLAYIFLPSVQ